MKEKICFPLSKNAKQKNTRAAWVFLLFDWNRLVKLTLTKWILLISDPDHHSSIYFWIILNLFPFTLNFLHSKTSLGSTQSRKGKNLFLWTKRKKRRVATQLRIVYPLLKWPVNLLDIEKLQFDCPIIKLKFIFVRIASMMHRSSLVGLHLVKQQIDDHFCTAGAFFI